MEQQPNLKAMQYVSESRPLICSTCSGALFTPVMMFRRISKLLTGSPVDTIFPVEVFRCSDCGDVLTELLPTNLPNDNKES